MALIVEIKVNEDTVEKYACNRIEELENPRYHYTYKAYKLIPATYEAFTNKIASWKKETDIPVILRHKYSDGAGKLAIRLLKAFNK